MVYHSVYLPNLNLGGRDSMDLPVLDDSLSAGRAFLLVLALAIAIGFEFVNGFHDTANAVATVIYTRAMKPVHAVLWSGLWNFLGVLTAGIGVAYSIVYLLPVDLLVSAGSGATMAMVLALLLSAILWNLGTWYVGIPASSSHALIGSILGVGLASSIGSAAGFGSGVNWRKAEEVGLALLLSPVFGFLAAAVLLLAARRALPSPILHGPPGTDQPPPFAVRCVLWLTCTGVSFAHGSNDGQKGIGLIMLILIGVLPATFALDRRASQKTIEQAATAVEELRQFISDESREEEGTQSGGDQEVYAVAWRIPGRLEDRWQVHPADAGVMQVLDRRSLLVHLCSMGMILKDRAGLESLSRDERWQIRTDILEIDHAVGQLARDRRLPISQEQRGRLERARKELRSLTDYAPTWVKIAVAIALGVGTTIGWKRIVITVGEKIGKAHMTYAQGACAEMVAMSAIMMADGMKMPVSTTHVLSSGVAGTMAAQGAGIQGKTIRNLLGAWILTLPVCILMAGALFLILRPLLS